MAKASAKSAKTTAKAAFSESNLPYYFRPVYVIAALSLLLNAFFISSVVYLSSPDSDRALFSYGYNRVCFDHYSEMSRETDVKTRAYFSERLCGRDYKTGQSLPVKWTSSDGKFSY